MFLPVFDIEVVPHDADSKGHSQDHGIGQVTETLILPCGERQIALMGVSFESSRKKEMKPEGTRFAFARGASHHMA